MPQGLTSKRMAFMHGRGSTIEGRGYPWQTGTAKEHLRRPLFSFEHFVIAAHKKRGSYFDVFRDQRWVIQRSRTMAMAMARIIVAPQMASVRCGLKPTKVNPVEII